MLNLLLGRVSLPLLLGLIALFIPQLSLAVDAPNPILLPSTATPTTVPANSSVEQPLRLEISRSQRRVTLYQGDTPIKSYAIAVGKPGWETPLGTWRVRQKLRNPIWIHPLTGESVKGGDPENPLGRHWIGFWTNGKNWIGFHGTPNPESVGQAASHGCVRMQDRDVEELFQIVSIGTTVKVMP